MYDKIKIVERNVFFNMNNMDKSILTSNSGHTAELQWLEHLWNHENMFEIGVVRASEVTRQNWDIISIFFNMKVYMYVCSH